MKKIKSSIYWPEHLKKALEEIKENDNSGRSLNQIAIDFLLNNEEVLQKIEEIKRKEG